jgi:hypothetical protein
MKPQADGPPATVQAIFDLLKGISPPVRIDALRRHPQLQKRADELDAGFRDPGVSRLMLLMELARAEVTATKLDGAPAVTLSRQGRKAGKISGEERRGPESKRAKIIAAAPKFTNSGGPDFAKIAKATAASPRYVKNVLTKK